MSAPVIDHVHLRVADFAASRAFYAAVLEAFGGGIEWQGETAFEAGALYVETADENGPSRVHLAFTATDEAQVRAFHAAALAAGGRDNGTPGPRDYHPGYFGAFVLDPDGNNIEAVWHGGDRA
ncbi:VOC family protein [Paracoccus suum]|uniref:VOC family protein n=1 Tax=Paracoccus suum TaxID=2259340 RepID=A0A344PHV2_9RHOB|nr:VOC family protein [Paracoccus suum]AXC48957.1 VOC family protein [Paracoccus suum]